MRRGALSTATVAATALIAGCGSAVVGQETIEKAVFDAVEASTGRAPTSVSCPGELPPTVGAEMRCTMLERDGRRGLTLRVATVDGSDVALDVLPDRTADDR